MTEWGVLSVLIVIVGFFASVIGLVAKIKEPLTEQLKLQKEQQERQNEALNQLTQELTRFSGIVDSLQKDVNDITERNAKSHDRLFEKLDKHDALLVEHDKRITILENK